MQRGKEPGKRLSGGFQSMHPIKDATYYTKNPGSTLTISIHAPYKGCNKPQTPKPKPQPISIHAPYKGCNNLLNLYC